MPRLPKLFLGVHSNKFGIMHWRVFFALKLYPYAVRLSGLDGEEFLHALLHEYGGIEEAMEEGENVSELGEKFQSWMQS
jgi:hypothetical protein